MENKELATSKKITQELIGGWILWALVFGLIYYIIYAFIAVQVKSLISMAIITIIMDAITTYFIWKFSVKSTFKKRTMTYNDVPIVMKNLIIVTIIICTINGIFSYMYNKKRINEEIDNAVNSDFEINYYENMMSYMYDDEQMDEYYKEKEDNIRQVKNSGNIYLLVTIIGSFAVNLAVLPLVKKEILKYVVNAETEKTNNIEFEKAQYVGPNSRNTNQTQNMAQNQYYNTNANTTQSQYYRTNPNMGQNQYNKPNQNASQNQYNNTNANIPQSQYNNTNSGVENNQNNNRNQNG